MIETWYNQDHKSKKEIAELLHKSERTIRREINRGMVDVRGYLWEEKKEYGAMVAQEKYEYGMTKIKVSEIQKIEDWINNYPRAMFDYKSSNIILSNI